MDDLLNKLKSLGLKIDKAVHIEPEDRTVLPIDKAVKGQWIEVQQERVFIVEKHYPAGYVHGKIQLEMTQNFNAMGSFINTDKPIQLDQLIFIDTETTSLSSGTGSFVFLIGVAYFDEAGLQVVQIFLDQPYRETPFLNYFDELIKRFSVFVSYNGKAFDIPMLRNRFVMNKLPHNLEDFQHFDLLHSARRIWKKRLESRKLSDIEKEVLSFHRSDEEIPGWLVPQIYFDYLESKDASTLQGVFYHNEIDVVSLAAIFLHINNLLSQTKNDAQPEGLDIYSIGYTLGKLGQWDLSEAYYQAGLAKGIPEKFRNEALRNYAYILKRQEKWTEAINHWESAAENGDCEACIELAKYYEHRAKDIDKAIVWTDMALKYAQSDTNWDIIKIKHRKNRLDTKIQKTRGNNG